MNSPLPPIPDSYINAGYHHVEEEEIYSRPGNLDLGKSFNLPDSELFYI